jgi:AcrR family transcriptional regulator
MTLAVVEKEKDSRRDRKARETRRKILQAALELFSERGVEAVTVEEIADRADFARGTVFNHFSSKETLCQGLGELQLEALQEAVENGKIAGPNASDKIVQALRVLSEMPGSSPEQCRAIIGRILAAKQPGEMPEHRRKIFEMLEGWAVEGQRRGELREDIPAGELACFVMGLQFQATLLWAFGYVDGSLADHTTRVLRLALEGIRARREADQR